MSLRERLRMLRPAAVDRTAPLDEVDREKAPAAAASPPEPGAPEGLHIGQGVTLRPAATPAGPVLYAENVYDSSYRHGRLPLAAALDAPAAAWRRLLPGVDGFPVADALFLDLETTGLSRGVGNYAFLVGVGRFVGGRFRVRQFFLRDFHEEPAALAALLEELASARAVVTFNGRSFDWPLLEARAIVNRLRLPRLPHLDLLLPARRVWHDALDSCRLARLEEAVLGVRRENDVPGEEIPRLYFSFLQTGDAEPLAGVIEHNRLDILSLAALTGYLAQAAADPLAAAPGGRPLSGAELYGLARTLLAGSRSREDWDLAGACLEEALRRELPLPLRRRCQQLLVALYKRTGRGEDAVALLKTMAAHDGSSPWAHIELAKHYEHRARDFAAAREWSLQALDVALRRRALESLRGASAPGREVDAILYRLRRLERRLRRSASEPS